MTDGKPSVSQIAEASRNGHGVQYEIVTYRGVEILVLRRNVENAIKITAEFTSDIEVIKLAETLGIKLRKFR